MFCGVLHFIEYSLFTISTLLISQIAKQYNYHMTKIHNKSFCYIYHVVQVNLNSRLGVKCGQLLSARQISDLVAQCLAGLLRKQKVPGSNPTGQEFFILKFSVHAPHSSSKPMQMKSTTTFSELIVTLIPCFR